VTALQNCWEIMNCGRAKGGWMVAELGECIASVTGLSHSCWAIAGTLCGGIVQGTTAQKEGNCRKCYVFQLYDRSTGTYGKTVTELYPDEDLKLNTLLTGKVGNQLV
jgi:hypothetical protein